ncbi:MAG TPA: hypothetical protein VFQ53_28285 [Kofleriaceae bacterium]|nr:hypothetical protein [Kofleriaceae bacterium]
MKLLIAAGVATQLLSCGGSEEEPPVCPTGDCNLPGVTVVKYRFDHYPEWLFESDTCLDLGVVTVHADATGIDDTTQVMAKDVACGQGQVSFVGLAPGNYSVALTPLDGAGNPIVKAPLVGQTTAGAANETTEITIDVPYESWTATYTGTFLFRLAWAGLSCDEAAPPVRMQQLTLEAGGQVVTTMTDTGQKLDGSDPRPCRPLTEQFAQYAEALPFGPARLRVVGYDATGAVKYDHQFETFVGAAKNNPTIMFDVPAPPPPDAGVDAGIDAM